MPLRIVITAGPSFAPLDQVRRLTNISTGELGTRLAEGFAANGHRVLCLRGTGATFSSPLWGVEVAPFSTNDDLQSHLERIVAREEVNFIFHAAALCDYTVKEVLLQNGERLTRDKASSRETLRVTLEPAPKVIARMRKLFPASLIVGWKYELDGTLHGIMDKGRQQMDDYLTDACVVNGKAYGVGYGVISREGEKAHLPDKAALCRFLIEWAERMPLSGNHPPAGQLSRALQLCSAGALHLKRLRGRHAERSSSGVEGSATRSLAPRGVGLIVEQRTCAESRVDLRSFAEALTCLILSTTPGQAWLLRMTPG